VIQAPQEDLPMSDQFWLTKAQLKRIEPFFPRTRGMPRVDDRRVVSGIIYVILSFSPQSRYSSGRHRDVKQA
jgi:hypothetical protein